MRAVYIEREGDTKREGGGEGENGGLKGDKIQKKVHWDVEEKIDGL
jgi:hypothetical protein